MVDALFWILAAIGAFVVLRMILEFASGTRMLRRVHGVRAGQAPSNSEDTDALLKRLETPGHDRS
jgi:hypothetical protein